MFCEKCGKYLMRIHIDGEERKQCLCKEFTIIDEGGEEHSIGAMNTEDAALKYAEKSNCEGDYYLMNESAEITVNDERFKISAEPDVYYSAEALKS